MKWLKRLGGKQNSRTQRTCPSFTIKIRLVVTVSVNIQ